MKENNVKELAKRLSCAIDWPRDFVGIRFLFTKEEYDAVDAKELLKPINYCQMVCAATKGNAIKATAELQGCSAAIYSLGIKIPDEFHRSGRRAFSNQLYNDLGTAKFSRDRQTLCDHEAYAVLVKPLSQFTNYEAPPQVIQVITNPYYAMRIIQGYTYYFGIHKEFKMSGLQAICSESTAYPYMSNNINISMLCGGTRMFCDWKDAEVSVSIPYSKFPLTVEGTLRTIDLEDPDDKKAIVREKLRANQMDEEFPIHDGFNYCKLSHNVKEKNKFVKQSK